MTKLQQIHPYPNLCLLMIAKTLCLALVTERIQGSLEQLVFAAKIQKPNSLPVFEQREWFRRPTAF